MNRTKEIPLYNESLFALPRKDPIAFFGIDRSAITGTKERHHYNVDIGS